MKDNEEKVEIIKPKSKKQEKKKNEFKEKYNQIKRFISPILLGVIGLVFLTNSNEIIIAKIATIFAV